MLLHSIKNKNTCDGVYAINNLPKIKDGAYVINLDEYELIGTHWIDLYVDNDNVTSFDSFGVEHISKEIKKFIGNKNITTSIYRIQACDLIMCGYFCTRFFDFILKDQSLLDYIQIYFLLTHMKKWWNNTKMFSIIKKLFLWIDVKKVRMRKTFCDKFKKYKEFKMPKVLYICDRTLLLSNICYKWGHGD